MFSKHCICFFRTSSFLPAPGTGNKLDGLAETPMIGSFSLNWDPIPTILPSTIQTETKVAPGKESFGRELVEQEADKEKDGAGGIASALKNAC